MDWPPAGITDPRELRALAHPRRLDLLELLLTHEQLTATQCAERLGDSPASCSYHLRTLERFGHVEPVEGAGRGRSRPWRLSARGRNVERPGGTGHSAAAETFTRVIDDRRLQQWLRYRDGFAARESSPWTEAAFDADVTAWVTPEELADISEKLGRVLDPYVRRSFEQRTKPDGSRPATFLLYGFPADTTPVSDR